MSFVLAAVGLRWPSLDFVGCCGASLAAVDLRWPALAAVGLRLPSLAAVGVVRAKGCGECGAAADVVMVTWWLSCCVCKSRGG